MTTSYFKTGAIMYQRRKVFSTEFKLETAPVVWLAQT